MNWPDQPFVLFDATYGSGVGLDWTDARREQLIAWARSQGMVPEDVAHLVIYPGEPPYAQVTMYDHGSGGDRVLAPSGTEYAKHVIKVPLTQLPPMA